MQRAAIAPTARALAQSWPAAIWLALIAASAFANEADGDVVAQAGTLAALAATAIAVACGAQRRPTALRSAWLAAALLAVLAAVSYASIGWSLRPEASWLDANQTLAASGAIVLGVVIGSLVPRPAETGAVVLCLATLPLAAWPIVERMHAVSADSARLSGPLGQANALGAFCAIALPATLWLASGHRLAARLAGGALAALVLCALLLSGSRGGVVAAAAGVLVLLLLGRRALPQLAALAAAGACAIPFFVWASSLAAFKAFTLDSASRTVPAPGSFLVALATALTAAALLSTAAQIACRRAGEARTRTIARVLAALAVLALAGALAGAAIHSGGPAAAVRDGWNAVINGSAVDPGTGRLTNVSGDLRGRYWREAVQGFRDQELRGNGAGAFEALNQRLREPREQPTPNAHSTALGVLSGIGIGGAVPAALALFFAVGALALGLRRASPTARPAAAAVVAGALALALHTQVDIDWSVPALTLCAYPLVGLLAAGAGNPAGSRRGALGAAVIALVLCLPVALPWLSARGIDRAEALIAREPDTAPGTAFADQARVEADLALRLDPLSVNGLLARSSYLAELGRTRDARRDVERALELEPTSLAALQALVDATPDGAAKIAAYRRKIRADPVNHESWFDYASYLANSDCAHAQRVAARARELAPSEIASQYVVQCATP